MKISNQSEQLMTTSVTLVEKGISESQQEVLNVNNEIADVLQNDSIEKLVERRVAQSEKNLNELIE
jgi:hypothetical protein